MKIRGGMLELETDEDLLTHLVLDEVWAVDFNGNLPRRKRSFGTALSWRVKRRSVNALLYLTLGVCGWLWWTQWHRLPFIPEPLSDQNMHRKSRFQRLFR